PQISGDAENIQRLLALKDLACTSDVDFVVASARKLEEEMVSLVGKKKVISIPNGVDTRHYRNPIHKKMALPNNVVQFRKKYTNIVGYFGALAPWLWYDLINDLVKSRPDLGFVFIGPDYYGGLAKLPKAENVLYLGVVDYKILPAYAHTFDVCFIPFALGEIAKTTSPLKLFEYFALMKPVVVTSDMQECIQFQEVFSGGDVSSISQAIDKAIVIKKDHEFCQKLSNLADQNDWDKRAQELDVVFQALKDGILSENRN
ncbi:MAG TPA: glycosyltransferase, partial [Agitococcus sp.]|nr:glycosyltransferase [Agitococcus sp.]HMY81546.1 glycosyltransferase [Agitococcus sp.]